jgi:hypothetical protein
MSAIDFAIYIHSVVLDCGHNSTYVFTKNLEAVSTSKLDPPRTKDTLTDTVY